MVNEEIPDGQRFIQGLARGLAVMRSFDAEHQRMRLPELSSRTGLSRATVRRCVLTLETLGYVRSDDGYFELTHKVLEFGYSYMSGQSLSSIARPFLEDLSARTGESTSLTVLSGTEILYIDRVHRKSIIRVDITIGTRFPAIVTSMGRVMLAAMGGDELDDFLRDARFEKLTPRTITDEATLRRELDRARESGWALVDQEFEIGLRSIAVPVPNREGTVVGAINVSLRVAERQPIDDERVAELVTELKRTAKELGEAISLTNG
ncbi:helix-turn-helix domain-containing protein [Actinoplanes bogorensis]|uniref:Helix-turn-helix domain-containing protein n=1 Tax=Paractinoplanes bogorensis TaxID=1610840 RepID=A0ABS5YXB9_9ACTN|nr:IclR family transcriptional regulator C-terminal domain-containing protein [Actinoplanes bogorensis]MBU2668080.1 helix-turn-helix domain-containing protein [Actinoplanes bogorensis]